jgi:hypothetical protein
LQGQNEFPSSLISNENGDDRLVLRSGSFTSELRTASIKGINIIINIKASLSRLYSPSGPRPPL